MIDLIKSVDWAYWWSFFATVVVAASAVVKFTPNKWDDKWHGRLLNLLALNPKPE